MQAVILVPAVGWAGTGLPDAALLSLTLFGLVLAGFLQVLFGTLNLGRVVYRIPLPVTAGMMSGIALIIAGQQIHYLLGVPRSLTGAASLNPLSWKWGAIAAGIATAVVGIGMLAGGMRLRRRLDAAPPRLRAAGKILDWIPPELMALLIGLLVHVAFSHYAPNTVGPTLGEIRFVWSDLGVLFSGWSGDVWRHVPLGEFVIAVSLLAIIASMDSLISASDLESKTGASFSPRRELIGHGAANMCSGILGGIVVSGSTQRAHAAHGAGARTRIAGVFHSMLLAVVAGFGLSLIGQLPWAVMGGLMLIIAWRILDKWALQFLWVRLSELHAALRARRKGTVPPVHGDHGLNALLLLAITLLTVYAGIGTVIVIGIAGAAVLMLLRVGSDAVTASRCGRDCPSHRRWSAEQEAFLQKARHAIRVLHLDGVLFFGNTRLLQDRLDRLPNDVRYVVLDCRDLHEVDATGATMLLQMGARLSARNPSVRLLLAYIQQGEPLWEYIQGYGVGMAGERVFSLQGAPGAGRNCYDDVDRAVEAAEDAILRERNLADACTPKALGECDLFARLAPADLEQVQRVLPMRRESVAAGHALYDEDDPDCSPEHFYLLLAGRVTISVRVDDEIDWEKRLVTLQPGALVGIMHIFDPAAGPGGEARAETNVEVLRVNCSDFIEFCEREPVLGQRVMTNLARQMSRRIRALGNQLRTAEA